jgi:hypothetical protein
MRQGHFTICECRGSAFLFAFALEKIRREKKEKRLPKARRADGPPAERILIVQPAFEPRPIVEPTPYPLAFLMLTIYFDRQVNIR